MAQVITRFAPSPTGMLHIGNIRTALINYLFTKKHKGKFILRMDDTDITRSTEEFAQAIKKDLLRLGLEWDEYFSQSSRIARYEAVKQDLIKLGRLYPCYETPEELDVKRKFQLSSGKPPIYDRAALKLTREQIANYESIGRKAYYRFLIKDEDIVWNDLIKGEIKYHGANLSDPVIIRTDGSMTYMLCSTVDDIDYNITHIIRGEDHVSNTAIQIQMFKALSAQTPAFGHLSLIKAKDDKISKRFGGYDISSLIDQHNIEPQAVNSFLALIGTSNPLQAVKNLNELVEQFDISTYSKSPTTYRPSELEQINHKLIISYEFDDIKNYLKEHNLSHIDEQFWLAVRPNLHKLSELAQWWKICRDPEKIAITDTELTTLAAAHLPQIITDSTWSEWTKIIARVTGKKGKELYMPLRLALTGQDNGPELSNLLPLLTREEIIARLKSQR